MAEVPATAEVSVPGRNVGTRPNATLARLTLQNRWARGPGISREPF